MKDILEFIIKNITTVPDDVVITEEEIEGSINFTVSVNQEDVGRLIAKEGKIIKSIRAIMRVIAIQRGLHVRISVISDEDGAIKEESAPVAQPVVESAPLEDSLTVEI